MVVISDEIQIKNAPTKVLLHTAQDIVEGICSDSAVFDDTKLNRLPTFSHSEIMTGRTIGRGGFCVVKEIVSIKSGKPKRGFMSRQRSNSNSNLTFAENDANSKSKGVMNLTFNGVDMSPKEYLTYTCNRGKGPYFVVKQVCEDWAFTNRITFLKGTVDLALEAKYLASLSHPNIVELRAVSEGGPFKEGYFIFLERLNDTLPTKLKKWTTVDRQCKGITGVFVGGKKKLDSLYISRMEAAYGIANALNYVHSRNLIYRDIVSYEL
jgi:serine/threonine protein kinase